MTNHPYQRQQKISRGAIFASQSMLAAIGSSTIAHLWAREGQYRTVAIFMFCLLVGVFGALTTNELASKVQAMFNLTPSDYLKLWFWSVVICTFGIAVIGTSLN